MLFERQYILTEEVVVETRYRTETRTGTTTSTDPETGETTTEEYEYEVEVPYDYYICYVTLENFDLSHLPVYIMGEEQVSLYAVYMATLGNRPDLFCGYCICVSLICCKVGCFITLCLENTTSQPFCWLVFCYISQFSETLFGKNVS